MADHRIFGRSKGDLPALECLPLPSDLMRNLPVAPELAKPDIASRLFWSGLSFLIAGLFFYAASTATETGSAEVAGAAQAPTSTES